MSEKSNKGKNKKYQILKVKDSTDDFTIDIPRIISVPFRMLVNAKSGLGKSNFLCNIFLNDAFPYKKIFKSDDIYLFSPTVKGDKKLEILAEELEVPDSNCFDELDDSLIDDLYENLVDDYKEKISNKETPNHTLVIIDDFSSSGLMAKRYNKLVKFYCNSRKFLCSIVILQQSYVHTNPSIRENSNALVIFNTSNKNLEKIEAEHNYLKTKKQFMEMFRSNVKDRDFLLINYTNKQEELYLDSCFEPIDTDKYLKKK